MRRLAMVLTVLAVFAPAAAFAYTGPGAGIAAIGSVFAVLGAGLFAVVGFIWYPFRRLIRALRRNRDKTDA